MKYNNVSAPVLELSSVLESPYISLPLIVWVKSRKIRSHSSGMLNELSLS